MLKRFLLSIILAFGTVLPSFAAGTINYSLSQQFDSQGRPLSGCKLYFYQAGTTTVQTAYQDAALTIAHQWPLVCDSAGRLPQFYLADGTIKIRLTDRNGVNQGYGGAGTIDGITVIGASSGSGSGTVVDPTTILQTGQFVQMYGTGNLTGFVRCNGRTIGSGTSGASERANSDVQTLFEYLWSVDSNLSVSGGRGASANADWTANKALTLPDCRGRTLAGLSDMGNSDSGRISTTYFGCTGLVLGCAGGAESKTLLTANLPPYTPSGTITNGAITINHNARAGTDLLGSGPFPTGASTGATITASQAASTFTGTAQGGTSTPFSIASPAILMTIYIKL